MKDLQEIANNEGLQVSNTVERFNNGYPRGIKEVITGFFDWNQVEDFIKRYGGNAIMLHKKDGWQMYERCDEVNEPMEITAEMYGDDYDIIYKDTYDEEIDFITDFLLPRLDGADNMIEVAEIVNNATNIWDSIESIKERNATIPEGVLIINDDKYGWREYDTIDVECIEWSHDTHDYMIGVIINDDEDDEE